MPGREAFVGPNRDARLNAQRGAFFREVACDFSEMPTPVYVHPGVWSFLSSFPRAVLEINLPDAPVRNCVLNLVATLWPYAAGPGEAEKNVFSLGAIDRIPCEQGGVGQKNNTAILDKTRR